MVRLKVNPCAEILRQFKNLFQLRVPHERNAPVSTQMGVSTMRNRTRQGHKRSQEPVKVCGLVTNTGSSPGIYACGDPSGGDGKLSSYGSKKQEFLSRNIVL